MPDKKNKKMREKLVVAPTAAYREELADASGKDVLILKRRLISL